MTLPSARTIEQLRYRTYTVQRAIDATRIGLERLAAARLYVLLDGRSSVEEFERLAQGLIEAGVDVLQLRDKRLADRELDRPCPAAAAVDAGHVDTVDRQ